MHKVYLNKFKVYRLLVPKAFKNALILLVVFWIKGSRQITSESLNRNIRGLIFRNRKGLLQQLGKGELNNQWLVHNQQIGTEV